MEKISRCDLLREYLNFERNNLFVYSRNYAMTAPKEGYETDWENSKMKVELLEQMIEEYLNNDMILYSKVSPYEKNSTENAHIKKINRDISHQCCKKTTEKTQIITRNGIVINDLGWYWSKDFFPYLSQKVAVKRDGETVKVLLDGKIIHKGHLHQ